MNTFLKLQSVQSGPRIEGRVLAIEPDSSRSATLRHVFEAYVQADCQIVKSVKDALASIARQVPDLVLTSTFLAPRDEALLTDRLKDLPGAAHVQIITTPYFIEDGKRSEHSQTKILTFLNRRRALIRPSDGETVGRQIRAYIDHARMTQQSDRARASRGTPRSATALPVRREEEPREVRQAIATTAHSTEALSAGSRVQPKDRRRARRKRSADVPSLWSVSVSSVGNVKLVDISTQGVLVETTAKIARGTAIELQLIGDGINVSAAARVTRSEVASVDGLGVRYQVAASFSHELDIPGIERRLPPAVAGPSELAELLAHALRDVDSRSTSARVTFEQGLRRLLSAVDVQIRHSALVPASGSESIYFTIPTATARKPILQAVFEPNHPPSPTQFKLLRAAAALAAVILEFSPVDESAPGVSG